MKENIAENTDQNDWAKFFNYIDISEFWKMCIIFTCYLQQDIPKFWQLQDFCENYISFFLIFVSLLMHSLMDPSALCVFRFY